MFKTTLTSSYKYKERKSVQHSLSLLYGLRYSISYHVAENMVNSIAVHSMMNGHHSMRLKKYTY